MQNVRPELARVGNLRHDDIFQTPGHPVTCIAQPVGSCKPQDRFCERSSKALSGASHQHSFFVFLQRHSGMLMARSAKDTHTHTYLEPNFHENPWYKCSTDSFRNGTRAQPTITSSKLLPRLSRTCNSSSQSMPGRLLVVEEVSS